MKIKGRPKQAIIQEKFVGFFMTWKQYEVLQKRVEQAQLNVSDYLRQAALTAEFRAKWTEEERAMVKKMIDFSKGLNELVRIAAEQGAMAVEDEVYQCREMLDFIIKNLCHAR